MTAPEPLGKRVREAWRVLVRMAATTASSEVGREIAVGEFYLPWFVNGWKLSPPDPKEKP